MKSRVTVLDDEARMRILDRSDMMAKVLALPRHCRETAASFAAAALPSVRPRSVVFVGLGGSAIGGDLMKALARDDMRVPATVCRDYTLPAFVGKTTLVLAMSYSGNTEETLEAYRQAQARGAHVVAFSSGGLLQERAHGDGVPHVPLPGGLPPRSALGYSFTSLLLALDSLGLVRKAAKHLEEAIGLLEELRDEWEPAVPFERNEAKHLAQRLLDRIPLVYGASDLYGVVAYRWRCQLNENAKVLAFSNAFPELNHNEVVPLGEGFGREHDFFLVVLRDRGRGRRLDAISRITSWYLKDKVEMMEIDARGKSPLARMMSHVFLGDLASVYLAALRGVDPTPIAPIDRIKSRMKKK